MCISPNKLASGVLVACHKCWQCREQTINDWVGRNIAESKTSTACHAVTLTYGRNKTNDVQHERALILTYSDVQKYLKRLRRHGYPVRYFVTGEFGAEKGRAHWHIMLYWQDRVPAHELNKRPGFDEPHWPHGYSFWTEPTAVNIRYNCKYVYKDIKVGDDVRQGYLAMSKKPPLGAKYFSKLAARYVAEGIAPQPLSDGLTSFGYSFGEVKRPDGKPVVFALREKSLHLFLSAFVGRWRHAYGAQPWPNSRLLDEFGDRSAWRVLPDGQTPFDPRKLVPGKKPWMDLDDWEMFHRLEAGIRERNTRKNV